MDVVGEKTLETMNTAIWYNRWLLELSERYLDINVLEIGSGIGNFTGLLIKGHKVTATDIQSRYIKYLKSKYKGLNVGYGDIENNNFFFKNRKFDTVIVFNVLEHIENDSKAILNIQKPLNKGGKMIAIVPAHMFLYSKFDKELGHFRRYTTYNFSEKVKASGLKIKELRYLNWISAIGWMLFVKFMNRSILPSKEMKIFNLIGPILISFEKFLKFPFGLSVYCVAEK